MIDTNGTVAAGLVRRRRQRRQWSAADKQRIVAESLEPGASVSVVARRHDLNANLLFTWRRQRQKREAAAGEIAPAFVPLAIAGPSVPPAAIATGESRIEIVLGGGERVLVGADVDALALARFVKALRQ